ncbi:DEAD-box ATP-dependent RNA helicase CshB-like [Clytia hemisphaerica]|uniref:ATP-dependent RNA helicase n=1 Tax=Clytia hemisphaerica TaxID=252671 RepID=A0A7M5VBH0_9CNID
MSTFKLCQSLKLSHRYATTEAGGQYKKFLTMLKRQQEPPYLYTSNPDIIQETIDFSVYKGLTSTIQKQQKTSNLSLFSQLGVNQTSEQLLRQNEIHEPLFVQQKSLPILFARRSAIIESETGSGKTLTYLLPILQNLGNRSCSNVIVVPTRELASQVYNEILKYLPDRRLAVRYVSGIDELQERKIDTALRESNVVIGTPKRLLEIFETKSGYFRNVRRIVLDEVDKLLPIKSLDKIGMAKTKPADKLLAMLTFYNKRAQMIATSATVSYKLIQELQDRGFTKRSSVIKCSPDEYKHGKVPNNIQHLFVVSEATTSPHGIMGNKIKMITQLFRQSNERSTLVFIPRELSVQNVADIFQEMGFAAVALYKKVLLPSSNEFEKFLEAFKEGEIQIVVCTEETVRGMDFPFINRAFLTYIPTLPEDYVHVAGRVGRANRKGIVTTVLDGADEQSERKRLKRRLAALKIKARKIVFN